MEADLGMAKRRDPDALPPANTFELVMYWIHNLLAALAGGNSVFAIKAGLLTGENCPVVFVVRFLTTDSSNPESPILHQDLCEIRI